MNKAEIKARLESDDRWLMVGMLTIFKYQTASEKSAQHTHEKNDVGFNAADGKRLTRMCTWLLRQTTEHRLRQTPNARLEDYFDEWACDIIRKRVPKYARQLAAIAQENANG